MLATWRGRAPARRALHSLAQPVAEAASQDVAGHVRQLMRSVPQQVALVVATMPDGSLHGATISSFTSISLHPEPLVAFSLRTPSRLVSALTAQGAPSGHEAQSTNTSRTASLTISLLSTRNQALAQAFSKPGADHKRIFAQKELWAPVAASTSDTPPGAADSMGSMACGIKTHLSWGLDHAVEATPADNESITFIARVVQSTAGQEGAEPLLYCDRRYIRAGDVLEDPLCGEDVDDPVVA